MLVPRVVARRLRADVWQNVVCRKSGRSTIARCPICRRRRSLPTCAANGVRSTAQDAGVGAVRLMRRRNPPSLCERARVIRNTRRTTATARETIYDAAITQDVDRPGHSPASTRFLRRPIAGAERIRRSDQRFDRLTGGRASLGTRSIRIRHAGPTNNGNVFGGS